MNILFQILSGFFLPAGTSFRDYFGFLEETFLMFLTNLLVTNCLGSVFILTPLSIFYFMYGILYCFLSSVLFWYQKGFPGGSVVKNLPAKAGAGCLIPGSVRSPVEGNGNPLQYSCPEKSMERSVWALKELETTWLLSMHTLFTTVLFVFWYLLHDI